MRQQPLRRCRDLMGTHGFDVPLLTKPANMAHLTGDGRLCAYCMVTRDVGREQATSVDGRVAGM